MEIIISIIILLVIVEVGRDKRTPYDKLIDKRNEEWYNKNRESNQTKKG